VSIASQTKLAGMVSNARTIVVPANVGDSVDERTIAQMTITVNSSKVDANPILKMRKPSGRAWEYLVPNPSTNHEAI
jgi:hypothetical protein